VLGIECRIDEWEYWEEGESSAIVDEYIENVLGCNRWEIDFGD